MNPIEAAKAVQAEVTEILTAAGIENVIVTLDILEVPAGLGMGAVVLVQPPELDFSTYHYTEAKWELAVISGPIHDVLQAWEIIVPIQTALQVPLSLDTAYPSTFQHPGMQDHPAYALAFTNQI